MTSATVWSQSLRAAFFSNLADASTSTDLDRVLNELLKRSPETKCIWRRPRMALGRGLVEMMSSELRMCTVLFMCCKSYKVSVFNQGQLILSGDSVQDINIHQHVVLPHRQKSTGPTTMCLVLVSILRCVSISWHKSQNSRARFPEQGSCWPV